MAMLTARADEAALSGLGRFEGWRENALVGYGLVVGLSGTGDSRRSYVTRQTLGNIYARLGLTVTEEDISSRNVAVVLVAATLPASANAGDRISVTVSSAGDARSLAGGILLMTPLFGPDSAHYAIAQGPLLAGGYSFEADLNQEQRNFPTTARLEQGATIERSVDATLSLEGGELRFLLFDPSFSTASRIAMRINQAFGNDLAWASGADEVRIRYDGGDRGLTSFVAGIESLRVEPERVARVVINERTGTIVAGADVTLSSVVISQGDLRVSVSTENLASQPAFIGGNNENVSSLVITNTKLTAQPGASQTATVFPNTTIASLVEGLSAQGLDTRQIIAVLQAMKSAGALHAEILVQ
ncbi:flagellar basal body P-ring protein FlgI [Hyphomonas sp.]|uniref:flagellar basal body P-ring protein FlgI n=1 Tax=Hyphomonas sp. TaxID=87 RepID=UPI0025BC3E6A|nr:flagellar basal body P-ring protein FlgI [Hyphomonas sp.]